MASVLRGFFISKLALWLLACSSGQDMTPAAATAPDGERALASALPGNVMPDFPYQLTADVQLDAGMIKRRQVHLDLPGQNLAGAMRRLARQWRDAGLQGTGIHETDGRLTAELWLPGNNGARGLTAPSYGGVYVLMVGVQGGAADPPQLQITIHAP